MSDESSARRKRPTLSDVGRLAGVDPSIASRVLNGEVGRVRPDTRDRIFAAAERLGYRPHALARALSVGRTDTIGVISPSLTAPGYASMIGGIEEAAAELGYVVLWLHAAADDPAATDQVERLADRVDGIIMASARGDGGVVDALGQAAVPFLLLNRAGTGDRPCVIGDDAEGARLAVAHLISLGHTRIAHVSGPEDVDTVARRRAGFVRALAMARLPFDEAKVIRRTDLTEGGAAEATRDLLTSDPARPTAVLFATITTALGGLRALRELRLSVPDDLSIVTFDESPIIDHLAVPLTAVRMPHAEMGAHAVRSLVRHLQTGAPMRSEVVTPAPELVFRHSIRRLTPS